MNTSVARQDAIECERVLNGMVIFLASCLPVCVCVLVFTSLRDMNMNL